MGISTNSEACFVARQSFLNHGFLIFTCILITAISIYLTFLYPWSMQKVWGTEYFSIKIPFFALLPIALIARLLHLVLDKKMVFTESYILFLEGLMSWKEKSIRIHYLNIKEIEIDQTLYQKIFGLADLSVTTVATQVESAILMPGIYRANEIKNFINSRISAQLESKDSKAVHE